MPNIHELNDNVATQVSNDSTGEVWFTNLDLKNAYSQIEHFNKLLPRRHSDGFQRKFYRTQKNYLENFDNLRRFLFCR